MKKFLALLYLNVINIFFIILLVEMLWCAALIQKTRTEHHRLAARVRDIERELFTFKK